MKTPSLKEDLKTLELGSEYFPRFTRDTTDDDVKNTMKRLKEKVKEQRELLVTKYQDKVGDNEEKIKEINAAAERIFGL